VRLSNPSISRHGGVLASSISDAELSAGPHRSVESSWRAARTSGVSLLFLNLAAAFIRCDRHGVLGSERAGEDRQSPKQRAPARREKIMAPFERRGDRLMASDSCPSRAQVFELQPAELFG
jgi:hypothetical protein